MRKRILIYALGMLLLAFSTTMPVLADPGFLDSSFGGGTGMVQIGFGLTEEVGQAVAFQSDGKYVVAGVRGDTSQFMVVRYGTNNLPDPSFGSNGVVYVTPQGSVRPLFPAYDGDLAGAMEATVQPDGKIVVAGTVKSTSGSANNSFFLMRLNPDGSLDGSFGFFRNGIMEYSFDAANTTLQAIALQSDGKIVTAGISQSLTFATSLAVSRLTTNGDIDFSFGNGVVLVTNSSGAHALALEGDGNILVGGGMPGGGSGVMRFDTNGVLDTTFGSGGKVVIPGANLITAVGIQPGGIVLGQPALIVAAGSSSTNVIVARMSLSGALDTSFNGTGVAKKTVSNQYGVSVSALRVVATGPLTRRTYEMLVSGHVYTTGPGEQFVLTRFNGDGSVDNTFGNGGVVLAQPTPANNLAGDMVIAPGLAILQVGRGQATPCETDVVLARYNWADGSPDTNFNGTGFLVSNFGDRPAQANAVAIQADGKIVVAGSCQSGCNDSEVALCRLNADGTLDSSFGNGGRLVMAFGSENSVANAMVIQPDGRIVITGTAYDGTKYSTLVARFLSSGLPDASFSGGSVITRIGTNSSTPNCIALQNDGKILVAADAYVNGNDIAILRYTADGVLDTNWNGTGKLLTAIGSGGDSMSAIAVQSDGKVIVSGGSDIGISKFSMVRCTTNGALDYSFGSFGRVATEIGSGTQDAGYGMVLQPDNRILLAGLDAIPPVYQYQVALLRYNPNGTLDSTFGSGGTTTSQIGVDYSYAQSLALQADGKLVAGCRVQDGPNYKYGVARFLANGTLDSAYGYGGVNYFDFDSGTNENLSAMALDSQRRAVMAGNVENLFTVVRVLGDTVLRITSISRQANGDIFLQGTGVPQASHTLLNSSTTNKNTFTTLAPVITDGAGHWQYLDTTTSGTINRFYRLSYP